MKVKFISYDPLVIQTFPITDDMVELPAEDEAVLISGRPYKYENGHIVYDTEAEQSPEYIEAKKEELRHLREIECYQYINRGVMYFAKLTDEEYNEMLDWYNAWLDVTETLVIPLKPSWLE